MKLVQYNECLVSIVDTRVSVATVLITHPCVSWCFRVKHIIIISSGPYASDKEIDPFICHTTTLKFIIGPEYIISSYTATKSIILYLFEMAFNIVMLHQMNHRDMSKCEVQEGWVSVTWSLCISAQIKHIITTTTSVHVRKQSDHVDE